jgi:hypothetical protein
MNLGSFSRPGPQPFYQTAAPSIKIHSLHIHFAALTAGLLPVIVKYAAEAKATKALASPDRRSIRKETIR